MKTVQRCVALSQLLVEQNFPAIAIHRGMAQEERCPRRSSFFACPNYSNITYNKSEGGELEKSLVFAPHRLSRYQQFKDFQRRILVATNLFGRGMDIERVNIVFNYDMPEDSDTYLHRVSLAPKHFHSIRSISVEDSGSVQPFDPVSRRRLVASQVARAGRFGTKGLAITFVSDENDAKILNDVQDRFEVNVAELPEEIDISSYSKLLPPNRDVKCSSY